MVNCPKCGVALHLKGRCPDRTTGTVTSITSTPDAGQLLMNLFGSSASQEQKLGTVERMSIEKDDVITVHSQPLAAQAPARVDRSLPTDCPDCGKECTKRSNMEHHRNIGRCTCTGTGTTTTKISPNTEHMLSELFAADEKRPGAFEQMTVDEDDDITVDMDDQPLPNRFSAKFACRCGKVFDKKQGLNGHKANCKGPLGKEPVRADLQCDEPVDCPGCGKEFSTRRNMERHGKFGRCPGRQQLSDQTPKFSCLDCGKEFRDSWNLERHRKTKENCFGPGATEFACPCGNVFETQQALAGHKSHCKDPFGKDKDAVEVTSGKLRYNSKWNEPIDCPGCGKKFSRKSNLNFHRNAEGRCLGPSSTDEANCQASNLDAKKPTECLDCGQVFTQKYSLDRHRKLGRCPAQPSTDQSPDVSTSRIRSRSGVANDAVVTSNDVVVTSKPAGVCVGSSAGVGSDFACACGKVFENQRRLRAHRANCKDTFDKDASIASTAVWESLTPTECHDCGKEFSQKWNMEKHRKLGRCPGRPSSSEQNPATITTTARLRSRSGASNDTIVPLKPALRRPVAANQPPAPTTATTDQLRSRSSADNDAVIVSNRPLRRPLAANQKPAGVACVCGKVFIEQRGLIGHKHTCEKESTETQRGEKRGNIERHQKSCVRELRLRQSQAGSGNDVIGARQPALSRRPVAVNQPSAEFACACGKIFDKEHGLRGHKAKCKVSFGGAWDIPVGTPVVEVSKLALRRSVATNQSATARPTRDKQQALASSPQQSKQPGAEFACPCGKVFDKQQALTGHKVNCKGPLVRDASSIAPAVGGDPKAPTECTGCGKEFSERWSMERHLNTACPRRSATDEAPVRSRVKQLAWDEPGECPGCGKEFAQRGDMETHRKRGRCTGRQPKVPTECKDARKDQIASGRWDAPTDCPDCGKEFSQRFNMNQHRNTDCPYRQQATVISNIPLQSRSGTGNTAVVASKSALRQKPVAAVQPTAEKMGKSEEELSNDEDQVGLYLVCPPPRVTFFGPTGNLKWYNCPADGCTNSSTRQRDYLKHYRGVHLKVRPWACRVDDCWKMFKDSSSRCKHERSHSDITFECPASDCARSYTRKDNLVSHIRATHPDQNYGDTSNISSTGKVIRSPPLHPLTPVLGKVLTMAHLVKSSAPLMNAVAVATSAAAAAFECVTVSKDRVSNVLAGAATLQPEEECDPPGCNLSAHHDGKCPSISSRSQPTDEPVHYAAPPASNSPLLKLKEQCSNNKKEKEASARVQRVRRPPESFGHYQANLPPQWDKACKCSKCDKLSKRLRCSTCDMCLPRCCDCQTSVLAVELAQRLTMKSISAWRVCTNEATNRCYWWDTRTNHTTEIHLPPLDICSLQQQVIQKGMAEMTAKAAIEEERTAPAATVVQGGTCECGKLFELTSALVAHKSSCLFADAQLGVIDDRDFQKAFAAAVAEHFEAVDAEGLDDVNDGIGRTVGDHGAGAVGADAVRTGGGGSMIGDACFAATSQADDSNGEVISMEGFDYAKPMESTTGAESEPFVPYEFTPCTENSLCTLPHGHRRGCKCVDGLFGNDFTLFAAKEAEPKPKPTNVSTRACGVSAGRHSAGDTAPLHSLSGEPLAPPTMTHEEATELCDRVTKAGLASFTY
jgi:uncharacterized Zn-finger protein